MSLRTIFMTKGFKSWLSQYHTANNPFFTPETQFDASSGVKALYTFGEEKAMGYSVFSVEKISSDESLHSLTGSYMVLKQMSPLLSSLGKKKAGDCFLTETSPAGQSPMTMTWR